MCNQANKRNMAHFSGFRSPALDVTYYSKVVINFSENGEAIQDLQHADRVTKNLRTLRSQELFTDLPVCFQGREYNRLGSLSAADDPPSNMPSASDDTESINRSFESVGSESTAHGNFVNSDRGEAACFGNTPSVIKNFEKLLLEGGKLASTDVCLVCKGEEIPCHRVVLSACNEYFRDMLTHSNLQESHQRKVEIEDADPDIMRILINYCYLGSLHLNMEIVCRLLATAVRYQFDDVEEHCCVFVQRYLGDLGDHVDIYQFATQIGCSRLVSSTRKVISDNFAEVSTCHQFLELQPDALAGLLELDSLVADNEQLVYDAVMRWTRKDAHGRRHSLSRLLALVRFPYVPQKTFKELVQSDAREFPESSPLLDRLVDFFFGTYSEKVAIRQRVPPRCYRDVSCCLNTHSLSLGYIAENYARDALNLPCPSLAAGEFIKCVLPMTVTCLYVTSLGRVWMYNFEDRALTEGAPFISPGSEFESFEEWSGAVLGADVYFVYTVSSVHKEGTTVMNFQRYNLDSDEYEELSPPAVEKGGSVSLAASRDCIYALSSSASPTHELEQDADANVTVPVHKYNIATGEWRVDSALGLPQVERRFLWLLSRDQVLHLATLSVSPCHYSDGETVCAEVYRCDDGSGPTSGWELVSRASPPSWTLPEFSAAPSVLIRQNDLHFIISDQEADDCPSNPTPNVTVIVVELDTGRNHVRHGYLPQACLRGSEPRFFNIHKYLLDE